MIAKLRRRHRRMINALAVVAPVVFFAALAARTPPATTLTFPAPLASGLSDAVPPDALSVFDSALLWPGLAVQTRVLISGDARYVELIPHEPVREPDMLRVSDFQKTTKAGVKL